MSYYLALVRREWLEHRSMLLWVPVTVTVLLITAAIVAASFGAPRMAEQTGGDPGMTGLQLRLLLQMAARPLVVLWFLTAGFYLLGTLYDERRDRTILFWKSLPVSDAEVVLAKLSIALLVAPAVALLCISLLHLSATALVASACPCGELGPGTVFREARLGSGTLHWLVGVLTQSAWWLPLWGWLLLVSAVAPRLPIVWALLVPLLTALLERLAFGSSWLWGVLARRIDSPALPVHERVDAVGIGQATAIGDTLALWLSAELWLGLVAGALFLAATVRLRRRLNEL